MASEPELTVKEVATLLRVHAEAVRIWLRAGQFPHARRLSRRAGWRIPREDVGALGRGDPPEANG
ncbi:MAG: helix-turn-helix domain-containing protein [Chloroflexota bacterium]